MAFIQGFGIGGGLIVAIGAQNAFVLSQGVRRCYPLTIALICAVCDAVLILLGVAGVGSLVATNPLFGQITVWAGAAFLVWYGALSLRSAIKGGTLETDGGKTSSLRAVITTTLTLTLLNPHVYLDTLVLLGSISGQFEGPQRWIFAIGAMSASFLWFFSLSIGAGFLAPLFRKIIAWRILDGIVCIVMWSIAASLIFRNAL